jgi:sigma-E factor negative regulatory protein RseB
MQTLAKANLPPLLSVPAGEKTNFNWAFLVAARL